MHHVTLEALIDKVLIVLVFRRRLLHTGRYLIFKFATAIVLDLLAGGTRIAAHRLQVHSLSLLLDAHRRQDVLAQLTRCHIVHLRIVHLLQLVSRAARLQ